MIYKKMPVMPKAVILDMKQRTISFHCISILVLSSTKCQNNDTAKRLKRQKIQNMIKDKHFKNQFECTGITIMT